MYPVYLAECLAFSNFSINICYTDNNCFESEGTIAFKLIEVSPGSLEEQQLCEMYLIMTQKGPLLRADTLKLLNTLDNRIKLCNARLNVMGLLGVGRE